MSSVRPPFAVEYGGAGVRFRRVLVFTIAWPVVGLLWLSATVASLSRNDSAEGVAAWLLMPGVIAMFAGVAWWPYLRPAVSDGMTAVQIRVVGGTYLLVGISCTLADTALTIGHRDDAVTPPILAQSMPVLYLGWLGWRMLAFARGLRPLRSPREPDRPHPPGGGVPVSLRGADAPPQ